MNLIAWVLKVTEGWKTVIGYVTLQLFGSYPLLLGAINRLLEDYRNPANWVEVAGHLLLALGVAWRAGKNFFPQISLKK